MRILFFSPYFYPYTSGITTYPRRILKYLGKNNEITVLTFKYDDKLSSVERIDSLQVIRLPFLMRISKGFISPQSWLLFLNYVGKTDILILNQPNFEGLPLAVMGKIIGKKIISIFHCRVFLEKNFFNNLVNYLLNLSMNFQLSLSTKIVAYTRDYVKSLPDFKKLLPKVIISLPPVKYIAPEKVFFSKLVRLKKNQIWIGYAGRISSEKGLEYLIAAAKIIRHSALLHREASLSGVSLVFAGPYGDEVAGENEYYKKIVAVLKRNKIKYRFFGNLAGAKLFAFYKVLDILILPSINQTEAFGMVQAEAMMAGVPVIASNLPGVRVPIELTKMGLVVEPANSQQLAGGIVKILKNKKKYANDRLIFNAKKIFDIKKSYHLFDKLINSISG